MNKLLHMLDEDKFTPVKSTRSDCLLIAREIMTDEPNSKSDGLTPESIAFLQLWSRMIVKTDSGHNLYEGSVSKGESVYPQMGVNHPIVDKKTGKFFVDSNMGLMNYIIPGHNPPIRGFLTGDICNGINNHFLAAAHYQAHRLHNSFIDSGDAKGYNTAKKLTLACLVRIFTDIMKMHLGLKYDGELLERSIVFKNKTEFNGNVVNTLEACFGFLRWSHSLVPFKIKGIDTHSRETNIIRGTDFSRMFRHNLESMGLPNTGTVSKSMINIHHPEGAKDIRKLSMTKFCEQEIATWGHFKSVYGLQPEKNENKIPLWLGIIDSFEDGRPDEITSDALCACIDDSCFSDDMLEVELPGDMVTGDDIMQWLAKLPR